MLATRSTSSSLATPDEVAAEVAGVLRARAFDLGAGGDAARTDLLRRLNRLTTLTHGPGQVRRLATTLSALLADSSPRVARARRAGRHPEVGSPECRRGCRAPRTARPGAGYAVHGDPGSLAPTGSGLPGTIDPRQTLEVAVEACLRTWRRQEGLT